MTASTTLTTRPLTGMLMFGTEILDFDVHAQHAQATYDGIKALADERLLLLIRARPMTEEQHVALSSGLGVPDRPVDGSWTSVRNPMILRLGNVAQDGRHLAPTAPQTAYAREAENWHSDGSFRPMPNYLTVLHSLEIPPEGGDTHFASMVAAFDALDLATKKLLRTLQMEHPYPHKDVVIKDWQGQSIKSSTHPVVRSLPDGREALFLSIRGRIVGMDPKESATLINSLFAHCTQARFVYAHRWHVGDTLIWNNRGLIHQAQLYDGRHRRLLQRTEVTERPVTQP